MNFFSAKIGAALFGTEGEGEIKINRPISSGIKMNVAFKGRDGDSIQRLE